MNELRTLVNAKVEEAGGQKRLGYELAAIEVEKLLNDGDLKTSDFSIRGLYEALCDAPLGGDSQAVAEDLNSSAFPTIVSKVFHKDIIDEYELALGNIGNLTRKAKATRTDEELVVGFTAGDNEPLLRRQGMAYEESDFGEKNWTCKMADFGRMISLTREVIYEDRTGEVMDRAKAIGKTAGQHKQKIIIQTIEGGARTSFGEALSQAFIYKGTVMTVAQFYNATGHAAFDGQLNPNLKTTNALADYTDVDNVWQMFAGMVDEAGNKINIVPNSILIPPALKAKAAKIFKGDLVLATTSVTDYNPINDLGGPLGINSSVYMADSTSWYMGDFPSQLLELEVFPPETKTQGADSELAFTNQIVARFRFAYHWGMCHTDWRHIIKSTS